MRTTDQTVRPHPEVVDTQLDSGEGVLLHLDSKMYYSLNVTGMRIWLAIKDGTPLPDISGQLHRDFDVDPERAERSVLDLVEQLRQEQLVRVLR